MDEQPIQGAHVQLLDEPFTSYDDYLAWLDGRPDEEHYEVVDGLPVMSPSPGTAHQRCLRHLLLLLEAARTSDQEVMLSPWDWILREEPRLAVRQPDLVLINREQAEPGKLWTPPLLAIEILSPSSVERDAVTKRRQYAEAGLDHYWIVDPQTPQIAIFRRTNGELVMSAHAVGEDEVEVTEPVTVRLRPSMLTG